MLQASSMSYEREMVQQLRGMHQRLEEDVRERTREILRWNKERVRGYPETASELVNPSNGGVFVPPKIKIPMISILPD